MPYVLHPVDYHRAYVVTKATGKKHSKHPLPMDTAKRQLIALNINLVKESK